MPSPMRSLNGGYLPSCIQGLLLTMSGVCSLDVIEIQRAKAKIDVHVKERIMN